MAKRKTATKPNRGEVLRQPAEELFAEEIDALIDELAKGKAIEKILRQ